MELFVIYLKTDKQIVRVIFIDAFQQVKLTYPHLILVDDYGFNPSITNAIIVRNNSDFELFDRKDPKSILFCIVPSELADKVQPDHDHIHMPIIAFHPFLDDANRVLKILGSMEKTPPTKKTDGQCIRNVSRRWNTMSFITLEKSSGWIALSVNQAEYLFGFFIPDLY